MKRRGSLSDRSAEATSKSIRAGAWRRDSPRKRSRTQSASSSPVRNETQADASTTSIELALALLPRFSDELSRRHREMHPGALHHALGQLLERGATGKVCHFREQELRQGHPLLRRSSLQRAMDIV